MALIPPFFLDCVVAIGVPKQDGTRHWVGTGFFLCRPYKDNQHTVYLVTNKHVIKDQKLVVFRANPEDNQPAKEYNLILVDDKGERLWTGHPHQDIDVAAIGINAQILINQDIRFSCFKMDEHLIGISEMIKNGVTEGDFVYVLGYPMGIISPYKQYVISRSGTIARIRDCLDKRSNDYLIDAFVFPGNSGSPVVYKPEILSIEGTKAYSKAGLLGIVKSYLPYQDSAISQQTGKTRILFEENSGLTDVIPVDFIRETVELCFKKQLSS